MILVVKLSGKVLEDGGARLNLCRQIAKLHEKGHELLVVHGGGKQLSDLSKRLNIPIVQHEGRRVTDQATMELATMVFSGINRQLVASLILSGAPAVGLSAFDGSLTTCRRRAPLSVSVKREVGGESIELVDFGLVGEIESVDLSVLSGFRREGFLPIISCLGADRNGQILNINADTLAAELAVALEANRLISVSDVDGIYLDRSDRHSRIAQLDVDQIRKYLQEGCFQDGMVPKVQTALQVLERGVAAVQIVDGFSKDGLLRGIAGEGGTLLCAQSAG